MDAGAAIGPRLPEDASVKPVYVSIIALDSLFALLGHQQAYIFTKLYTNHWIRASSNIFMVQHCRKLLAQMHEVDVLVLYSGRS